MKEVMDILATWLMVVMETIITVILIDDIYGFKEMKRAIKKYGKMKARRIRRQFLKTSKQYFRKRITAPEDKENQ